MATGERRFENRAWLERLPIHLADRIAALMSQIALNGEHTTASETVAVIETMFRYLGRLWVAEYLHVGAASAAINRDLLDFSSRPVLTGHWVSLARRIRHLSTQQSLRTVVAGLEHFDFGAQDDATHPVTRLIAYRNSFNHGSLASVVEDIRAHRQLIEQLIAGLPALWEQPIHCFTSEDAPPRLAVDGWPLATEVTGHKEPPYQPFIVGTDGQTHLRLYPLLHVAPTEESLALRAGDGEGRQHALETLFEREALRLWYGRYRREQQGHLMFEDQLRARTHGYLSPAVFSAAREALSTPGVARLIVEAHPGCGKVDLVAHLERVSPPSDQVVTAGYVIEPGGLSQSGVTFAHFLLRRAEAALRLGEGACSSGDGGLPAAIAKAEERLSAAGVVLLVGVDDLHRGITACHAETLSVADIFALPSGTAIRLLGTVHPGREGRHLPCDRRIVVPAPGPACFSIEELRAAFSELCPPDDGLGRRTLLAMLKVERPLTLFELCDALDETGHAVFEPAVEQTLWRLRPLLVAEGVRAERQWQPLKGLCRSWFSSSG